MEYFEIFIITDNKDKLKNQVIFVYSKSTVNPRLAPQIGIEKLYIGQK